MWHRCHAENCTVTVPPALVMCARHWAMVPRNVQRWIWKYRRKGQDIKAPGLELREAMKAAIRAVKDLEEIAMRGE